MIAVIADDLTGAAEIGGVGLHYGLSVEIVTAITQPCRTDLLVICTDTRSMKKAEAIQVTELIINQIILLKPTLIFKKIDSVLRGHIIPEIRILQRATGLKKILIVAGNPSLGRTISNGYYYLNNEPVHLSSFSKDPEFPVISSEVHTMLRVQREAIHHIKQQDALPEKGIAIGDVTHADDFKTWVSQSSNETLLAGTSLFFSAVLGANGFRTKPGFQEQEIVFKNPALFVCGTTFQNSIISIKKMADEGGPVCYIPDHILFDESGDFNRPVYADFANEVAVLLARYQKIVIAFDQEKITQAISAYTLRTKMALVIKAVFKTASIKELIIEGGSTAAAVIKELHFSRFYPAQELKPGVIRMQVEEDPECFITLKPGSYPWPPNLWNVAINH